MERQREAAAPTPAAPTTVAPGPAAATGLLAIQRLAGNEATKAMIRRTGEGGAASAASAPPPPAESAASAGPALLADDAEAIADPLAYVAKHGSSWDAIRKRYKQGLLTFKAGGDKNGVLQGDGGGMNALLAFRLRETVAKKADAPGSNSPMERILPDVVAEQTRKRAAEQKQIDDAGIDKTLPPPAPLKWNYGAGSGTATSDIDVNLAGDATEYAVKRFNEEFRGGWGGKESGTVFDVNVYGRDYLPTSGGGSLAVAKAKFDEDKAKDASTAAPGAIPMSSADWAGRGVTWESTVAEGSDAGKELASSQEVASLLKTRKDMSNVDWLRYKQEQLAAFGKDTAGRSKKQQALDEAETVYQGREAEIRRKMEALDAAAKAKLAAAPEGAAPPPPEKDAKEKRLEAENRIYEEKLAEVGRLRSELVVAKAKFEAGQISGEDVEQLSNRLQKALHVSSMYGNEAYVTGAAVLHVVGNLQILGGNEDVSIGLSADDYLASCNEQLGFIFDDFEREHGQVAPGLLKCGKYISRLGHAALKVQKMVATKRGEDAAVLAGPTPQQVKDYGDALMRIKDMPAASQIPAVEAETGSGWSLAGRKLNTVKTEILKFASKVQALGAKL